MELQVIMAHEPSIVASHAGTAIAHEPDTCHGSTQIGSTGNKQLPPTAHQLSGANIPDMSTVGLLPTLSRKHLMYQCNHLLPPILNNGDSDMGDSTSHLRINNKQRWR